MDNRQTTNNEILDKINDLSDDMQNVLDSIRVFSDCTERRFEKIENEIFEVKKDLSAVKVDLNGVKATINTQMVTKDYLDQKISELRGDILTTIRKEDNKLGTLTNKLAQRKILPTSDIQEILSMEPFPKVS